jgi:hypothetical protein
MQRAARWMPQPEIDFGCSDISYRWVSEKGAKLVVLMHFSGVIDGWDKDLELVFSNPLAVMWEDESFGLIDVPSDCPRWDRPDFRGWTFPTLTIENSAWAERYAARKFAADDPKIGSVKHYYLVSLNDLMHVLNQGTVHSKWVDPLDA